MKIFCVGLNYVDHVKEFGVALPTQPVVFSKPETAILKNGEPTFYPEFTKHLEYETEIIIKISKEGKFIEKEFAHKYYEEIGLGFDFTARDLLFELKAKGFPWDLAKGFNGSAPISEFIPVSKFKNVQNLAFHLNINGELKQKGNTEDMIFKIDELISFISKFFLLKKGDIIFTGTPVGVGPVQIGDKLEAFLEGEKVLECEIK